MGYFDFKLAKFLDLSQSELSERKERFGILHLRKGRMMLELGIAAVYLI